MRAEESNLCVVGLRRKSTLDPSFVPKEERGAPFLDELQAILLSRAYKLCIREFDSPMLIVMQKPGRSVHGEQANFTVLVLVCIDASDGEKGRIFQHFSRSTRFPLLRTAPNPKFQQKLAKISSHLYRNFAKFYKLSFKLY